MISIRPFAGVLLPGAGWFGSATGTEAFARGILSRYDGSVAQVAPVEAVLRAMSEAGVTNFFRMITNLSIRPAFVTRLLSVFGARDRVHGNATPVAIPPVQIGELNPARSSRLIFERIFARERRTETLPERAPASLGSSAPLLSQPVDPPAWSTGSSPAGDAMVLLHRKQSVPLTDDASVTKPTTTNSRDVAASSSRAGNVTPQPGRSVPFSPGEIGRLTDEIVRAIDRRIIAQRERRGVI